MAEADRKRTEQELRQSEAEFRAMFELAGSGKCQTDPATGRFLRVNRKLCEITGYSSDELLKVTFIQITHPDDQRKDMESFQRLIRGEIAEHSVEKRYLRKDGSVAWVHVTTALIRDEQGRPRRTVGVVQDISDRKRIEQALRESEDRYRLILENALEYAIFTVDPEGRVTSWNSGAQRVLGYRESEIIGRRLEVIFSAEDRKRGQLDLEMGRALTNGRAQDERWHVRKDGSPFWATGLMMPLKADDGRHLGFLKILRDRTNRKRNEEALRESESLFRAQADATPVLLWMSGPDRLCTYFNKPWLEFTGRTLEQELGEGWVENIHPEDRDRSMRTYKKAFERRQSFEMDFRMRRADGEYSWITNRGVPRFSPEGAFLGYIGGCIDITERKHVEERFVRLNETLLSVLQAIPDIVFVTGADDRIQFKNPAASEFAAAVGIEERLPAPMQAELERVMRTGKDLLPTSLKVIHRFTINNEERCFLNRIVGMKTPAEVTFGAVVMLQDVTEFRLLDEVKTNLISTVSHELKTPITSLRTALALLTDQTIGPLNPRQREMAGIARDEAERLLRTLNELLDLTRFEENSVGMRLEPVAPSDLILAAMEETRVAAAAAGVMILLELEPDLPPVNVDRERMGHVLTNFLTNAIKYSPPDGEVLVRARKQDAGIYFSVSDQGPGVPEQYHSRLFEKFFRVPGNLKKGVGLGLSIAREFVRAHRGRIGVRSERGQGSEFFFILPLN